MTSQPDRLPAPDPAEESDQLCTFCVSSPDGQEGHSGLSQQVYRIPPTDRSYVTLACVYCGAKWVRRRVNAKSFEWLRLAG